MVRTLIDPNVEKRGERKKAVEIAEKMLLNGEPIKKIIEYTGLTENEIKDIQKAG